MRGRDVGAPAVDGAAPPLQDVEGLPYMVALRDFQRQFAEQGPRGPRRKADAALTQSLNQAQVLLHLAVDHLLGFELLVRAGGVPTWAPYSLLRPALEVAQRAKWLLEGGDEERLRRAFSAEWADLAEEHKDNQSLTRAAGEQVPTELVREVEELSTRARAEQRALLGRAARQDVPVAQRQPLAEDGSRRKPREVRGAAAADLDPANVAWVGTPYPNATDLLRRLVSDEPNYGPMVYRRLSSPIHGRPDPTRPLTRALADAPDPDGFVAAERSVNLNELQFAYEVATSAVLRAAMSLADASGYCRHRIGLAKRSQLAGDARERRWPPPLEVQRDSTELDASCICCRDRPTMLYTDVATGRWAVWCHTCPPLTASARDQYASITGHQFTSAS